jgi:hypothetical protein
MPFARPVGVAAALGEERVHRRPVEVGHVAEAGVVVHGEVDVAVRLVAVAGHLVRVARGEQPFDRAHDQGDCLDRPDVGVRRENAQGGHVLGEQVGLLLRQDLPVHPGGRGPFQQRIIDVRDVLDVPDLPSGVPPSPVEQVKGHIGGDVAQMGGVIGGDAADVHPRHRSGRSRDDAAGSGVEQPHGQASPGQTRQLASSPTSHIRSLTGTVIRRRAKG